MQKSKIKTYLIFVFILFVFVLYFSLKDNYVAILDTLSNVNVVYLILGIIFVFISKCLIGVIVYNLAKREKKDTKLKRMLHIELIYPFFAGITPGSLGGESFEILFLKESGLSYGKATSVTIQKYILYEISLIVVNFMALILNLFIKIVPFNGLIISVLILNFLINIVILLFLYLLAYNKKFSHFIMNQGLSFLHRIRIVKELDKTKEKLDGFLNHFNDGVKNLKNDKKLFVKLLCISVLSLIFFIWAAFPVARSLGINGISIIRLFVLAAFVRMMSLLLVTPGNSGAAEYSFIYIFTGLLAHEDIMAYMLIWRFVTYYIPLITGGGLAMMWRGDDKNE